mgnify:CR=1 FL=1
MANTRKRLPKVLTTDELNALRAACPRRSATGLRNRAMVEAMAGAGLRVSEVVALRPKDIDWTKGTIRVNQGKGNKDRVIPVTAETLAHLQAWASKREGLGFNGHRPFFLGLRTGGDALSTRAVQDMVANLAARAGIEHCTPHTLRHTYATGSLADGLTIREVQDLLGHSSVATTQVYLHVDPEALRAKVQGRGARADKLAELQEQIAKLQEALETLAAEG